MGSGNRFHDHVEDMFSSMGVIRIRQMFGGAGVYCGEYMFALLDDETIYIKSDADLKASLEAEGGEAFEWTNPKTNKTLTMSYVSLPTSALDDHEIASRWGRRALDVARKASRAKVKSPRRRPL